MTGNINDGLPYPDNFFDTVLLGQVLEHLNNPIDALINIRRVLKEDGRLILDVPNPYSLKRIIKYIVFRNEDLGDPTHIIFYTPASLKAVLYEAGFDISIINTKLRKLQLFT